MNNKIQRSLWMDDELKIAIDSYIYMLQLQISKVDFSVEDMAKFLTDAPLSERNSASLRYRMRNISFVFQNRNLPILKAYSPAPQVGAGVRKRIENILDEYPERLSQIIEKNQQSPSKNDVSLDEVMARLDQLEKYLGDSADKQEPSIGHNNPPEPMEELSIEIKNARKSIHIVKDELKSSSPDIEKIHREQNIIAKFGLKLATMTEASLSVFTKAVIATTAAGVTGALLVPYILETLESLASYIQSLG